MRNSALLIPLAIAFALLSTACAFESEEGVYIITYSNYKDFTKFVERRNGILLIHFYASKYCEV